MRPCCNRSAPRRAIRSISRQKLARERFGLRIYTGYLESARCESESFDVVYLCEVLEHVDQPMGLFREIRRVLKRRGVVVFKTGNVRSLARYLRGPEWTYFAYRRLGHVSYFSPATVRILCSGAGLSIVRLRTWGVELPRGPLRSLLRAVVRPLGWGGHLEAIARRP